MPTETLRAEPDSSTHASTNKKKKRKRKHKGKLQKRHSKKTKHNRSSVVSSDSQDQSDIEQKELLSDLEGSSDAANEKTVEEVHDKFTFDIKPLGEYLPDVKALYKQVFTVVNKKEFKQMLPENLKKYDPREVRKWCLEEMEGISIRRLKAILCNKPMTSSSSESEANVSEKEIQIQEDTQQMLASESEAVQSTATLDQTTQDFSILAELSKSPNETEIDELLVGEDSHATQAIPETMPVDNIDGHQDQVDVKSQSKSEILELELRARALQSFLKFQEKRQQKQSE